MRILFADISRPRNAASWLRRSLPGTRLADARRAIAHATGYRDWHDLESRITLASSSLPSDLETTKRVILSISDELGRDYSEVHYCVCRSRLLGRTTVDEMLTVRAMLWRERLFGGPDKNKPGTVVQLKSQHDKRTAYLVAPGKPTHLLYDTGPGQCADFEVINPRDHLADFAPSRLWLPYGYWKLQNGDIITFSRDYMPMWRLRGDQVTRMEPWLWINGISEEKHFSTIAGTIPWSSGLARELALEHLDQLRVAAPPMLLNAMPYMFSPSTHVSDAVERMRQTAEGITTQTSLSVPAE